MRRVSSTNWKTQINCFNVSADSGITMPSFFVDHFGQGSEPCVEISRGRNNRCATFDLFQRRFAATLCAFSLKKVPLLFLERSCNFLPTTERWREELQPLFCYHRSRSGVVFISSTKSFKFFRLRFAGKSCSSWNRMFSIHLLLCCRSSCLYRTEVSGTCWGTESGKI